jgi:CHAT domain-containing protein/Tfp pilus assembly protein PilF
MKYQARLKLMRLILFVGVSCSALTLAAMQVRAQEKVWKLNDHVEVEWKGDWYQAQIIQVQGNRYKVHYDGYENSWDEWVDNNRIRAARNNPTPSTPQSNTGSAFDQVVALLTQSQGKFAAGQVDEAISLADRALKLAEKELGPDHGAVGLSFATLAQLYDQKADYNRAESFYQQALVVAEKPNSGLEASFVATLLNGLGHVYDVKGDYARAEPLYKRALAIQEKTLGPENSALAMTLTNLGVLYQTTGNYDAAEQLLQRALAIREKNNAEEFFIIQSLKSLASLYEVRGNYDQAGSLLLRAVTRLEKLVGPDNPILAPSLSDLALHYKNQGDFVKAGPLYERAITILEKAGGPDNQALAIPLDNLANLYREKGDYERAEPLYKRALAIWERSRKADDPELATTLSNLAGLYGEQRRYAEAEPLLQRAIAIKEKALGPTHPDVATLLSNLSVLYYDQGDYEKAELVGQHVLSIKEKAFGPEHPDVAIAVNNLAALKERRGDYRGAETLYRRALAIYEKTLGPKHPDTTNVVLNLAMIEAAHGDMSKGISYLTRGTEISEYNADLILTSGSEEQKRRYMDTLTSETNYTISLHLRSVPNDLRAARLALTTILRRKGRALDAMTEQLAALRRRSDPQDHALLEQLDTARSKLAYLVLNGAGKSSEADYRAAIAKLEAETQRLEASVSARSAEFRARSQPVTIESVQKAMPSGTTLIEIASYQPYNALAQKRAERYGKPRYAAYLLSNEGDPRWVDLGDAAEINAEVATLRNELRNPRTTDVKQVGRQVYEKIMRPIVQLLGNSHELFLSPDSDLNLIPFGALVDENGRYLVENYSITYLTSGRDLLRLQVHADTKSGPVIFANPLFNQGSDVSSASDAGGRRSADLRNVKFSPLPGTAAEAKALAGILPRVKILTGEEATEAALKQVSGPSILHIATHGFFLPDRTPAVTGTAGDRGIGIEAQAGVENPLLRSGLALAGVNQRRSGAGEDGVLTAVEAASLDLWGTKLVVLSACETGLGEVKNGEGVYGLRRALVLAGSESQVMSLWQVSDAATRDLMTEYYKRLEAGEGRTEALRQVQIAMIKSKDAGAGGRNVTERGIGLQKDNEKDNVKDNGKGNQKDSRTSPPQDLSHPFYWAAFIQSGDWRSLER